MLKPYLKFSCKESWDDMQPTENGRYCNSCNKTVVDFTAMDNQAIINYLKAHSKVCGHLKSTQLNPKHILRPIVVRYPERALTAFKWPMYLLSAGSILLGTSCNDNNTVKGQIIAQKKDTSLSISANNDSLKMTKEIVVEQLSGEVEPPPPRLDELEITGDIGAARPEKNIKNAAFKLGNDSLNKFIQAHINYPENGPEGEVQLLIKISKTGQIISTSIHKTFPGAEKLETEALRLAELLKNDWNPAEEDGEAIESEIIIPIQFER